MNVTPLQWLAARLVERREERNADPITPEELELLAAARAEVRASLERAKRMRRLGLRLLAKSGRGDGES